MTLLELQELLGKNITKIDDLPDDVDKDKLLTAIKRAETVAHLAKQMINNADVILRRDVAIGNGKIQEDAISKRV